MTLILVGFFGFTSVFRWLQAYQYLRLCVVVPDVFKSISIDHYLKVDDGNPRQSQNILNDYQDMTGKFDFQSYMTALKENKQRKQKTQTILKWVNYGVFTLIIASMVYGIIDPLVTILFCIAMIFLTLVMNIVTLRKIHLAFSKVGKVPMKKREINLLIGNTCFSVIYWSVLAYAQVELILMI